MMQSVKDLLIQEVQGMASRQKSTAAAEFARARPGEREELLAELEFQAWFEESCDECLYSPEDLLL